MKNIEKMYEAEFCDEKHQLTHSKLLGLKVASENKITENLIHLEQASPLEILSTILKYEKSRKIVILGGDADLVKNQAFSIEVKNCAQLGIFTSGTTGSPKLVLRETSGLLSKLKLKKSDSDMYKKLRWGLLYSPEKMSGIQVLLSAYVREESLFCPPTNSDLQTKIQYLIRSDVNAVSATPSMWKYLIQNLEFCNLKLKQITLGGEAADTEILETLRILYPQARIIQIYASTEYGVILTVRDGRAGFPKDYLINNESNYPLKISADGDLLLNFGGQWRNSGDMVEISDNRVKFIGRSDKIVNIGGEKVDINKVEAEMLKLGNIIDVVVSPIANKILGNALVADVVCEDLEKFDERALKMLLREKLFPVEIPAMIRAVPKLALNSSGKRTIT